MKFCRIDLSKTNYQPLDHFILFIKPPTGELQSIYSKYCRHKQFESVMPIFDSQFDDVKNDVFGYTNEWQQLVAFSIVRRYNDFDAESLQFAWDYADPALRLGIRSLEHECAIYKSWGYRYLYLGQAAEYKSQLLGYEELNNPYV